MARPTHSPFGDVDSLIAERGQFLTYSQAAELTSVSVRTLKRLARAGELPAYRMGNSHTYRLKTADVVALFRPVAFEQVA